LHLLNNSLSVMLLKHGDAWQIDKTFESNSTLPIPLLVVAFAMIAAIGTLLWQTRVRYVLRDGSLWNPGYETTAAPGPEVDAVAMRQSPRLLLLAGSLFNSAGFATAVWQLAN